MRSFLGLKRTKRPRGAEKSFTARTAALLAQGQSGIFLAGDGTLAARGVGLVADPGRAGAEEVEDEQAPVALDGAQQFD